MSKDIRSFFTQLGSGKKKEDKAGDKVQLPKKRGAHVIISDSDDDDIIPVSTKKPKTKNGETNSKIAKKIAPPPAKKLSPKLKAVKAMDVFGSSKIKRSVETTAKEKKVEVHKDLGLTASFDDMTDEDFAATCQQLDAAAAMANETLDSVVANGNKLKVVDHLQKEKESSKSTIILKEAEKRLMKKAEDKDVDVKEKAKDIREKGNVVESKGEKRFKKTIESAGDVPPEIVDNTQKSNRKIDSSSVSAISKVTKEETAVSKKKEEDKDKDKDEDEYSWMKNRKKSKKDKEEEEDEHSWMKDPAERRRVSAIGYQRYLNREGPKHLGLKEIPKGLPDCLKGLVFVVTGVLDSLERDAAETLIQEYGGKVTKSVSRNTSYIVVGEDAGPSKVHKAEQFGTAKLDEDGLLDLIRTKSGMAASKVTSPHPATQSSSTEQRSAKQGTPKKGAVCTNGSKSDTTVSKADLQKVCNDVSVKEDLRRIPAVSSSARQEDVKKIKMSPVKEKEVSGANMKEVDKSAIAKGGSQLWVDKYRPTSTKQIIGQQGDSSNVKKLTRWLENWQTNQFGGKVLKRPDMYARNDDGSFFKAALLSGPPGVGKTTTVHLVCKELGLDVVEFNASDTRSKKLLHEEVSELLSSKSLYEFFRSGKGVTSRHVLVMDEVDGMAGNEDRGGIAALIQLIKTTKVPIVAMCNDSAHQKMRSLVGNCFHLRFNKPRVEQIRGALMSVCFKEGLKLSPTQLSEMIIASSQDVRQALHHLSMCSPDHPPVAAAATSEGPQPIKQIKNIRLGPFDVVKKVFSAEEHKNMTINDKLDLFFFDYSMGPLFVQQNYLHVTTYAAKNNRRKELDLTAEAADSMCWGDVADKLIRKNNAWSLLPTQGMFASVLPGDLLSGHMAAMIDFPAWLGKNSQRNKQQRLLTELHLHVQLKASCDKLSLNTDYLPFLRDAITRPLLAHGLEGVPAALSVLLDYNLLRTDIDSIMEVSVWKKKVDPWAKVDSKVKAALTRAYKSANPNLPYNIDQGFTKKKANSGGVDLDSPYGEVEGEGEGEEGNESDDDDIMTDARIKVKAKPAASKAAPKRPASGSSTGGSSGSSTGGSSGSSTGRSSSSSTGRAAAAKKSRGRGKSK